MVQNVQLCNDDLNFSGGKFRVGGSFKARRYLARDPNNILVVKSVSFLRDCGVVFRSKNDLGNSFPVS
jgi:hypothetical protein